jgi:hypothetical protein
MAQKETHKHAETIHILKQTIKKIESENLVPIRAVNSNDKFLFPKNIVGKDYLIQIKEIE